MTRYIALILATLLISACVEDGEQPTNSMQTIFTPKGPVFVMPTGHNTYMVI